MKKKIGVVVCVMFLVAAGAGFGCSKKSPYQFALDAVKAKSVFAQDKKHWAMQYTYSPDSTKISPEEALHFVFLVSALQGKNNGLLPKEGEVVVCWQDKGKGVFLSIFDPAVQVEKSTLPLLVSDCQL